MFSIKISFLSLSQCSLFFFFLQTFFSLSSFSFSSLFHQFLSALSFFFLSHWFFLFLPLSNPLTLALSCLSLTLTDFPWVWVTVLRRSLWVTWSRWVWVIGHSLVVDRFWWWVKFCDGWILRLWWWLFCDLVAGFFFCDWCFVMDGFWQLFCNLWWLGFGNCFVIGCLMDRFCDLVVVL